jgi:prolyl oligopeptidase
MRSSLALAGYLLAANIAAIMSAQTTPPKTHQENFSESFHGQRIIDPYHWLENSSSKATREWIDAQNRYSQAVLNSLPAHATIFAQLSRMLRHDRVDLPMLRNGYYYFGKQAAEQDLQCFYRRKATGGPDELLIDPHPLSKDHTISTSTFDVSDDGKLIAYGVRQGGQDETDLRILDVGSRRDLPDHLPSALYTGFAFNKDGRGFYYSVGIRDKGKRVYHHVIGSDPSRDSEAFGKGFGSDAWIEPTVSENGRYLLITVQHGWAKGDLYIQDLQANGPIRPIVTGSDAKFDPAFCGDFLIVRTNLKSPKYRILRIDLHKPAQENWREIVPASHDSIEAFSVVGGKLFVRYLHDVVSRIKSFSVDGVFIGDVSFPDMGAGGLYGRADQREGVLYFSSYTLPYSIYLYDTSNGERKLWYRDNVPFQKERFETKQIWYPSKDGTRIPMFIVHRKDLQIHGDTPTILYGYGGFDVSITPFFNPSAAWWIEHGGIYAVANLRGGGEFGEEWHRAGMLERKQNVFDDFIAGAEWLIANKYTNSRRLGIWGGSNGGLLVAAALTQRPELYRAVICWHPDLDMVRYYKYTKNNNPPALLEYGDASDAKQFRFLYAYSPYERVRPGTKYPAVLLESGDADTRVPPEQARKMTARLQNATSSNLPVLLIYNTKAGHAGGEPLKQVIQDSTSELSFLAWQLGLN